MRTSTDAMRPPGVSMRHCLPAASLMMMAAWSLQVRCGHRGINVHFSCTKVFAHLQMSTFLSAQYLEASAMCVMRRTGVQSLWTSGPSSASPCMVGRVCLCATPMKARGGLCCLSPFPLCRPVELQKGGLQMCVWAQSLARHRRVHHHWVVACDCDQGELVSR